VSGTAAVDHSSRFLRFFMVGDTLEAIVPPALRAGRFKATDDLLLASLASASVMRSTRADT